jgi:hypothetical protein
LLLCLTLFGLAPSAVALTIEWKQWRVARGFGYLETEKPNSSPFALIVGQRWSLWALSNPVKERYKVSKAGQVEIQTKKK